MLENRNPTILEIMDMISNVDGATEQQKIDMKVNLFYKYIAWTDEDYQQYNKLLDELIKLKKQRVPIKSKKDRGTEKEATKKSIGDALEAVVDFIFEKSFFYKVYENKRTSTHEIDQFVVLSDRGRQALEDTKFTRDLLITTQDYFLCECKNYKTPVSATWVGKFNTLLEISGKCSVGLFFSCEGLTGKENTWYDAHGLAKTIYRLSDDEEKRFILDITIKDLELLRSTDNNIFKIIKTKKESMVSNIKSENLYDTHEGYTEIKSIYKEILHTQQ